MLVPLALCLAPMSALSPVEEPAPRLVVMIAVDQLVPEQLERLRGHLPGGLGRLQRQGLRFTAAALPYGTTHTGPGHATFATGCLPSSHGLVANDFYDRDLRRDVYCVEDREALPVTSAGLGVKSKQSRSPRNLRRVSLGAHLRASVPEAKIVALSGKDRAAITMAGRSGDIAIWWDRTVGAGFVSTQFYGDALPSWVERWNKGWVERTSGWLWEPSFDVQQAPPGTAPDERVGEGMLLGQGPSFPYTIGDKPDGVFDEGQMKALYNGVYKSPLMDRYVLDLAHKALFGENLGTDEHVDLLALSFSSCDAVGHIFGPYSVEVTDTLLRLDHGLGKLFTQLDERVGKDRWVAVLTADHGVLPLIESLQAQGVPTRRIGPATQRALQVRVEAAVAEATGLKGEQLLRFPTDGTNFDFDLAALAAAGLDVDRVRTIVAKAAVGENWVQAAYTRAELLSNLPTDDPMLRLCRASNTADRGHDVQVVMEPHCLIYTPKWGKTGTSHGSPHSYDRRIPLIFYGPSFPAEARADEAGSQDVVPTLLELLGMAPIGPLDGRTLLQR
ncbi:MAG: hypothetical protein ACI8QC_004412 [Planctomycetota bacterium]|jgi:hypothetical protein